MNRTLTMLDFERRRLEAKLVQGVLKEGEAEALVRKLEDLDGKKIDSRGPKTSVSIVDISTYDPTFGWSPGVPSDDSDSQPTPTVTITEIPTPSGPGGRGPGSAHGVVGGSFSEIRGGSFKSGFLAAGFSSAVAPLAPSGNVWAGAAFGAAAGGAGSILGGGKFADGAVTGAFTYLFNECLEKACWEAPSNAEPEYEYIDGGRASMGDPAFVDVDASKYDGVRVELSPTGRNLGYGKAGVVAGPRVPKSSGSGASLMVLKDGEIQSESTVLADPGETVVRDIPIEIVGQYRIDIQPVGSAPWDYTVYGIKGL